MPFTEIGAEGPIEVCDKRAGRAAERGREGAHRSRKNGRNQQTDDSGGQEMNDERTKGKVVYLLDLGKFQDALLIQRVETDADQQEQQKLYQHHEPAEHKGHTSLSEGTT